jgi:hypothetical protein
LEKAPETAPLWAEAFKKLKAICKNCGVSNVNGL